MPEATDLFEQFKAQGYAVCRSSGDSTTAREATERHATDLYYEYCESNGLPYVTATYTSKTAKYALVEIDNITTLERVTGKKGEKVLSAIGVQMLSALASTQPKAFIPLFVPDSPAFYISVRRVSREMLPDFMAQVVTIVKEHTIDQPTT